MAIRTDLMISEYIEGSGFNKALEFYNGTGSAIDLTGYSVEIYFNGNASPGATINLAGTVADGDVFVLADDGADSAILAQADQTSTSSFFNGDDAIVLRRGTEVIDSFGQVGVDPGTEWPGGGANDTLRRLESVHLGDTDPFDPFDASVEYDAFPSNTFDDLGSYAATPTDPAPQLVLSEVMFNPASDEDDWEWVEITNTGTGAADLSGWVIDDFNSVALSSANIASGTIGAGESAILYNADDVTAQDFEAAWGTGINLIAVASWSALGLNNGGDTIGLWQSFADYQGDNQTQLNAELSVAFPGNLDDGTGSIYLTDLADQQSWALSTDGVNTPAGGAAYTSAGAGGNSGADIGSPGGTLEDDPVEPEIARIFEIQGESHVSPFVLNGRTVLDFFANPTETTSDAQVKTTGVVTAVDSNGFYLQDEDGDEDDATSDAIFVFTGGAPGVSVLDRVEVVGNVSEFFPGGAGSRNLSTTQLSNATATQLGVATELPDVTFIGSGGRVPVTGSIDDDAFAEFQPDLDGIDFFESLEGMLVTANDLVAVAGTSRFGEIFAVADGGAGATGLSSRGTLNISPDDYNPEKIQIDEDTGIFAFDFPDVDAGAILGDVTGVVGYSFGNFEIYPTQDFTANIVPADLAPETSDVAGSETQVTVASYNVLNLDPNDGDGDTDLADGRFDTIAQQIISNLNTPDIVALQEVQDNSGSDNDGTTAANETLQTLVDSIAAAGGPTYAFIDNEFILDGESGGQPGGNIRTAFLYNADRVELVDGSVQPISSQAPGDVFNGARLPLSATFGFNGEEVTVVNNHFSSKGGSAPIFGREQPFEARQEDLTVNGSLDERQAQSEAVRGFVSDILSDDAEANVVVLGDFNEFEFISPVSSFETETGLVNLTNGLDEGERYSFNFQGNSQALDHILVTQPLAEGAEFDVVHVNSEFADSPSRASDHDPLLVALELGTPAPATSVARLDFEERSGRDAVIYSLDGEEVATDRLRFLQRDIEIEDAGITIDADDNLWWSPEFITTAGKGIGVRSIFGDRLFGQDRKLVDGRETLSFSLDPTEELGNAVSVALEFEKVRGTGEIKLSLYDAGALVDELELGIEDKAVAYALSGEDSFDTVEIGTTGSLSFSLGAAEFVRTIDDGLGVA